MAGASAAAASAPNGDSNQVMGGSTDGAVAVTANRDKANQASGAVPAVSTDTQAAPGADPSPKDPRPGSPFANGNGFAKSQTHQSSSSQSMATANTSTNLGGPQPLRSPSQRFQGWGGALSASFKKSFRKGDQSVQPDVEWDMLEDLMRKVRAGRGCSEGQRVVWLMGHDDWVHAAHIMPPASAPMPTPPTSQHLTQLRLGAATCVWTW